MTLRLLILSDIHNQNITLKNILKEIEEMEKFPDICLVAGDITNFGTIQDMENILNMIVAKIPNTFYVIGNCDPLIDTRDLETPAVNAELGPYELDFFSIIGFGTLKPLLNQKKLRKLNKAEKNVCLLTHVPPYGTDADLVSLNRHTGSKELRDFIVKNKQIFLSISGHIHESPAISKLNNCNIVNPGPVTIGNFAIIEIQKNLKVEGKIYNLQEI